MLHHRVGAAESRSFLNVHQAADALLAAYAARIQRNSDDNHSRDRGRQITEILALIDPNDIFEHDAFLRSFLDELTQLEAGGDVLS